MGWLRRIVDGPCQFRSYGKKLLVSNTGLTPEDTTEAPTAAVIHRSATSCALGKPGTPVRDELVRGLRHPQLSTLPIGP